MVGDSELIAKQVQGLYKVKHEAMKPLHRAALQALGGFERWSIRTVPRAQNAAPTRSSTPRWTRHGDGLGG